MAYACPMLPGKINTGLEAGVGNLGYGARHALGKCAGSRSVNDSASCWHSGGRNATASHSMRRSGGFISPSTKLFLRRLPSHASLWLAGRLGQNQRANRQQV